MIKTLQNTQKQDKMKFKVPKSVQDAIPIHRIWSDGIFQFGSKRSIIGHRFISNSICFVYIICLRIIRRKYHFPRCIIKNSTSAQFGADSAESILRYLLSHTRQIAAVFVRKRRFFCVLRPFERLFRGHFFA